VSAVFTGREVCQVAGAVCDKRWEGLRFGSVTTDSRAVKPMCLFVALQGENFDGHRFVIDAVDKGAVGVVVSNLSELAADLNVPAFRVNDTLKAYQSLARLHRDRFSCPVVAITGSNGKTSTKDMVAAVLAERFSVLKTEANYNNEIGLPKTLLQMEPSHEVVVVEMGMRGLGEIAALADIAHPTAGVVTNVGETHIERLGSIENIAIAKGELVEALLDKGLAVLNGDDAKVRDMAKKTRARVITFGLEAGNSVQATMVKAAADSVSFVCVADGGQFEIRLPVPGIHNVYNALAAAAIGLSLNLSTDRIQEGLSQFEGIKGRFKVVPLPDGSILIDDTYNSNPSSLRLALESLKALAPQGRRLIVGLGEMLELGEETEARHVEAGEMVADAGADWLVALGDHAPEMIRGALDNGFPRKRAIRVKDHKEMGAKIREVMKPGDLVFLKASRRLGLDRVADRLRENA